MHSFFRGKRKCIKGTKFVLTKKNIYCVPILESCYFSFFNLYWTKIIKGYNYFILKCMPKVNDATCRKKCQNLKSKNVSSSI